MNDIDWVFLDHSPHLRGSLSQPAAIIPVIDWGHGDPQPLQHLRAGRVKPRQHTNRQIFPKVGILVESLLNCESGSLSGAGHDGDSMMLRCRSHPLPSHGEL